MAILVGGGREWCAGGARPRWHLLYGHLGGFRGGSNRRLKEQRQNLLSRYEEDLADLGFARDYIIDSLRTPLAQTKDPPGADIPKEPILVELGLFADLVELVTPT